MSNRLKYNFSLLFILLNCFLLNELSASVNWTFPVADLSATLQNAFDSQITTDNSGKYVYVIWRRWNGSADIVQTSVSSDYGNTFSSPIDLSSGSEVQITTNTTGQYAYAIWKGSNGANSVIQISISSDFGSSWSSAITLSAALQNATIPQITIDNTGQIAHAIWRRWDGSSWIVQTRSSTNFGSTWGSTTDLSATLQFIRSNTSNSSN